MAFSDYIIFADESGSPVLENPDPTFPVFVLNCVLVAKDVYATTVVPRLQKLKFEAVGHDQVILHERDIRRAQNAFAFLQRDPVVRERFLEQVNAVVEGADVTVAAAVIHKVKLAQRYANPWSPYELGLQFCLETLLDRLIQLGQAGRTIHVIFEARGKREDRELELFFRQMTSNQNRWGYRKVDFMQMQWEPLFVDKRSNSSGLQLADLMARPIGLAALRPAQHNRAYEVLRPKMALGGMKVFP